MTQKNEHFTPISKQDIAKIKDKALLSGYEILTLIDSGGTGLVFKALNKEGNEIAFKLLKKPYENQWLKRFSKEFEILTRLNHHKIVKVLPPGAMDIAGYQSYAMEFINGVSLRKWLQQNNKISEAQAIQILRGVGEALSYVHKSQVIHRDLHSGNILLEDNELENLKVVDFGTARDYSLRDLTDSVSYKTFRPIGAMGHCAPEKWVNPHRVDTESDIFSVGVLIYNALTGKYPFWSETYISLFEQICSGRHINARALRPDISKHLDELIEYMLDPSRLTRLSSADDLYNIASNM